MNVHVKSAGPRGFGTTVTTEDGALIHGVRRAVCTLDCQKANTVELELVGASVDVKGIAKFMVKPPVAGGDFKEIKRIEFVDGSVFEL